MIATDKYALLENRTGVLEVEICNADIVCLFLIREDFGSATFRGAR